MPPQRLKNLWESLENLETTRKAQRDQLMVVSGQIAALEALLDPDLNHNVEMPFAGDDIEELHAKRLEGQDGLDQDEVRKFRERRSKEIQRKTRICKRICGNSGANP
jgi:hypothetical protein